MRILINFKNTAQEEALTDAGARFRLGPTSPSKNQTQASGAQIETHTY